MQRVESNGNTASKPARPAAINAPGYFKSGTVGDFGFFNSLMDEVCNVILLKGGTLDRTLDDQLADILSGVLLVLESAPSGLLDTNPTSIRALLATTGCDTNADNSLVAAAVGSSVLASKAAVIAGNGNTASGTESFVGGGDTNEAAGLDSAVLGGTDGTASGASSVVLGGTNNACTVAGAGGATVGGEDNSVEGLYSAAVACDTAVVSGDHSAAISSGGTTVSGDGSGTLAAGLGSVSGNNSAAVGGSTADVSGDDSVVVGGVDNEIGENGCAIVGSANCTIPSTTGNDYVVVLGSKHCNPDLGATEDFMVCGGYHATTNSAPTWRIESNGGTLHATNTTVQGLDYAEFIQNADGIPHEPGQTLAHRGLAVTLAKRGDPICGGVSVAPTITGGDDSIAWQGRYLRDEWGALVFEEVKVEKQRRDRNAAPAYREQLRALRLAEVELRKARVLARRAHAEAPTREKAEALALAVDAHVAAKTATRTLKPPMVTTTTTVVTPRINPAYRPEKHTPRASRPAEWTRVGLVGQIRLRVDETVKPDSQAVAGDVPGVLTAGRWVGEGAQVRCMAITSPFDAERGYAIALCLVR